MRIVLRAAIPIIGYRGISAIVPNKTPSSASSGNGTAAAPATSAQSFPVTLASAYAAQFGQVYMNFSPGNATERANEPAAFIPANARAIQSEFGWDGAGTMQTILATVNGRLAELGVPLYASGSGIVSGEPAWRPARAAASLPSSPAAASDPAAQRALLGMLPAFFEAYASGDRSTLDRFLAPGASVGGLGGAVTFGSIASLTVPPGGATRDITVTINWVLSGQVSQAAPQLAAIYDMSVIDQPGGRWYVREIRASTQPMGTQ
jgi:hypothetical protein